jgi:hypothetical protein
MKYLVAVLKINDSVEKIDNDEELVEDVKDYIRHYGSYFIPQEFEIDDVYMMDELDYKEMVEDGTNS